jgi:hypothetical protein
MWIRKREPVKKIALSVASALLIVVVSGGVATAESATAPSEGGSATAQTATPLTNGWD